MAVSFFVGKNMYQAPVIRQKNEEESFASVAGLHHVTKTNSPMFKRLLWLGIFFTALGLCVYQGVERFNHFLDDHSRVDTYYLHNHTLEFPTMTVCPFNKNIIPSINRYLSYDAFRNFSFEYVINLARHEAISTADIWNLSRFAYQKIKFFIHDGKKNLFDASKSLEFTEVPTILGTCIKLKPKRNLYYIGADTSMKVMAYNIRTNMMYNIESFIISYYMAEDSELENYFTHRASDNFLYGNGYDFYLRMQESIYRNTKTKPCTDGKTSVKCRVDCLDADIITKANQNCRLPYMKVTKEIPPCKTWQQMDDVIRATVNATSNFQPEKCNCLRKCRIVSYDKEYVFFDVNLKNAGRRYKWAVHLAESMFQVTEERQAYSAVTFFSDFGGTIGLYLGLCLLDTLDIIVKGISHFFTKFKRKRRRHIMRPGLRKPRVVVVRKNLVEQYSPFQDIPGYNNFANKKHSKVVRVLWLIIFLMALIILIYQCSERIAYFLSEPTFTSVYFIYNKTLTFPSLMLCPNREDGFIPAVQPLHSFTIIKELSSIDIANLVQKKIIRVENLWNMSQILEVPNRPADMLADTVASEVSTLLGTCKYFTPYAAEKGNTEYHGKLTEYFVKIYLRIHASYRVIYFLPGDLPVLKYIAAQEGYTTDASKLVDTVRVTQIERLNLRRDPCSRSGTVAQCFSKCIMRVIISTLDHPCRLPFMDQHSVLPECRTFQDMEMVTNATLDVIQNLNHEECQCPRKCKELFYRTDVINHLVNSSSKMINFSLKLSSNKIIVIEDIYAYNIISLLSDVGGVLSLFLGLCGLQIIELLTHVISKIIVNCVEHQQRGLYMSHNRTILIIGKPEKVEGDTDVGIPGFNQAFKSGSWWRRIAWASISVLALLATCYQCAERIDYFLMDSSTVSVYQITNQTIIFPSIIQCYFVGTPLFTHPVPFFFMKSHAIEKQYSSLELLADKVIKQQVSIMTLWNLTKFNIHLKVFKSQNIQYEDLFNLTEINTAFGVCSLFQPNYPETYNGSQTKILGIVGTNHLIKLYPGVPQAKIALLAKDDTILAPYITPKYGIPSDGMMLIDIRITQTMRRNTAATPCDDGVIVAECLASCYVNILLSNVTNPCRLPYMLNSPMIPTCDISRNGIYDFMQESLAKSFKLYEEDCPCPKRCNELSYFIEDTEDLTSENINLNIWQIALPNNKITVIEEEAAYTFFKLLSDLGGAAGLLFGLGVLQIIELFTAGCTKLLHVKSY